VAGERPGRWNSVDWGDEEQIAGSFRGHREAADEFTGVDGHVLEWSARQIRLDSAGIVEDLRDWEIWILVRGEWIDGYGPGQPMQ
jgi:hypothetical protein